MATNGQLKKIQDDGSILTLNWEIVSTSIVNLTSTIRWRLRYDKGNYSGSYNNTHIWIVKIGNEAYSGNYTFNGNSKEIATGQTEVYHNADGTRNLYLFFSVDSYDFRGQEVVSYTTNTTVALDTIDFVRITAFDYSDVITQNTGRWYFKYINPFGASGEVTDISLSISLDGNNNDIIKRLPILSSTDEVTGEITLSEADQSFLMANTQGASSRTIYLTLMTTYADGQYRGDTHAITYMITGVDMRFNPQMWDSNSRTVALTGDNTKFIRHMSELSYDINCEYLYESYGVKSAVLHRETQKTVATGDRGTINLIDYTETGYQNLYEFTVTNSRNTQLQAFKSIDIIPYNKPTCILKADKLTAEGDLTITISGSFFNGNFGAENNTLQFEYGIQKDDGDINWHIIDATPYIDGNSYSVEHTISGLDYKSGYNITANTIDELAQTFSANTRVVKATPVFDWSKEDFRHNTQVIMAYNKPIVATRADGSTFRAIEPCNGNGHTVINWDSYNEGKSNTEIYGERVAINSNKDITINNNPLTDFVTEQATNGIWHYRKWNSGRVELSGYENINNLRCNTSLGGWYRTEVLSAPPFPFEIQNPKTISCFESDGTGAMVWNTTLESSSKPADFYLIRPTSSTAISGMVIFYTTGRWK